MKGWSEMTALILKPGGVITASPYVTTPMVTLGRRSLELLDFINRGICDGRVQVNSRMLQGGKLVPSHIRREICDVDELEAIYVSEQRFPVSIAYLVAFAAGQNVRHATLAEGVLFALKGGKVDTESYGGAYLMLDLDNEYYPEQQREYPHMLISAQGRPPTVSSSPGGRLTSRSHQVLLTKGRVGV